MKLKVTGVTGDASAGGGLLPMEADSYHSLQLEPSFESLPSALSGSWLDLPPGLAAAALELVSPMEGGAAAPDAAPAVDTDVDLLDRLLNAPPSLTSLDAAAASKKPRLAAEERAPIADQQQRQLTTPVDREQDKRERNKLVAKRNRDKARAYKETLEQANCAQQAELAQAQHQLEQARASADAQRQRVAQLLQQLHGKSALAGLLRPSPGEGAGVEALRAPPAAPLVALGTGVCVHVVDVVGAPATLELCLDCARRNTPLSSAYDAVLP